jgi:hypothetical protein
MAARIFATMAVRGSHIIGAATSVLQSHQCGSHITVTATATASGQGHLQERKQGQGHLIGCKDRDKKKQRKGQNGRMRNKKKVRHEME